MKNLKILITILSLLLIANKAWAPPIGGGSIGPIYGTTGLYQVSAITVTADTVYATSLEMQGDIDLDGYKLYYKQSDDNYTYQSDSENVRLYIASTLIHTWTYDAGPAIDYFVLLETGDFILLETGDKIILE